MLPLFRYTNSATPATSPFRSGQDSSRTALPAVSAMLVDSDSPGHVAGAPAAGAPFRWDDACSRTTIRLHVRRERASAVEVLPEVSDGVPDDDDAGDGQDHVPEGLRQGQDGRIRD